MKDNSTSLTKSKDILKYSFESVWFFVLGVSLLKIVVRHKRFNAELAENAKNEVKCSAHGIIERGLYLRSSVPYTSLESTAKIGFCFKVPCTIWLISFSYSQQLQRARRFMTRTCK